MDVTNFLKPKQEEEILENFKKANKEELIYFVRNNKYLQKYFNIYINEETNIKVLENLLELIVERYKDFQNINLEVIIKKDFSKKFLNEILLKAINTNNYEVIRILYNDKKIDLSYKNNKLIRWAIKYAPNFFKELIKEKSIDPSDCDNEAYKCACIYERKEIINLLLKDKRVTDKLWMT
jgi:hypothetical protein